MTRKKVKLSWIVNDNARKASLKKRKMGLIKKVSELHTLCAVSTFIIIFGPGDTEPTFWPPIPAIFETVEQYRSCPDMEKSKKMVNQEGYLKQRLKKVHDECKKIRFKRKQTETSCLMHQWDRGLNTIDDFTEEELQGLSWLMETRQRNYKERDSFLEQKQPETEPEPQPVPVPPPPSHDPAPQFGPPTNMDGLVYGNWAGPGPVDDTGVFNHGPRPATGGGGGGGGGLGFFDDVNNPWPNNQYFPGP